MHAETEEKLHVKNLLDFTEKVRIIPFTASLLS